MKKNSRIIPLNTKDDAKYAKWWLNEKEPVTFAMQDKEDCWWLVDHEPSASYVNQDPDVSPKKFKKNKKTKDYSTHILIILSVLLGVSFAFNLISYLVLS